MQASIAAATATATPDRAAQDGLLKRVLVKDGDDGSYADLVFFRELAVSERVSEAEQDRAACADFFTLLATDSPHRVYEVLKRYD